MITLPSTIAPSSTTTFDDSTELRTEAAEMMLPAPTTDSCAEPPLTNFAGARFSDSPRIGHRLLYRLNTGCTDTRSICAS
ncbi:Putative transcriptional regulator%2C GntR family [Mycobacterium tuberculosis]|nr:Putative transcriptional regulator%2C GntR family [Mycobacterium tuberculosis]